MSNTRNNDFFQSCAWLTPADTAFLTCFAKTWKVRCSYAPLCSVRSDDLLLRYGIVLGYEHIVSTSDNFNEPDEGASLASLASSFTSSGFPDKLDNLSVAMAQQQKLPLVVHCKFMGGPHSAHAGVCDELLSVCEVNTDGWELSSDTAVSQYVKLVSARCYDDFNFAAHVYCTDKSPRSFSL